MVKPKENFDGYEFVSHRARTKVVTLPTSTNLLKTSQVTDLGDRKVTFWNHTERNIQENFDGYNSFVPTRTRWVTLLIYKPIENLSKKVTTIWVTEKGEVLTSTDGEQPKKTDGYEFVRTDKGQRQ